MVDSGYFLADESSAHGALRVDTIAKDEPILRAYDQFPVDIANLSSHDLPFISPLMSRSTFAKNSATYPILKRLVSANIQITAPELIPPQAYVVRNFAGRSRASRARGFRVAFVGITEPAPSPPEGFKFADPVDSAKRTVAEARRVSDFVIVLARVKTSEAIRIAREVPDIDVLIAGTGDMFTPPLTPGKTLIAFTPYETRGLGELRVYRNGPAGFSARLRYIPIDGAVPDDPAALQVATATALAGREATAAAKNLLNEWLLNTRALSFGTRSTANPSAVSPYVSSSACAQCHAAQYIKWANSRHAHATDALVPKDYDFDASCLDCHASGAPATTTSAPTAGQKVLQSVQCEQCHGPGRDHALTPDKSYGRVGEIGKLCISCHTAQTSPKFDLQTYWNEIKH